ncbi:dual specificity protein phosphatase 12 [Hydra vulgaris]|uniref:dual specificity protein phosphatase 12 n=1 Tax=Hydra vulgaris TaxID=6087 RepID=UPI001F5FD104|nr:dual specificity protein phosphatase 12 isoform X1 [Hydra vulgaris]
MTCYSISTCLMVSDRSFASCVHCLQDYSITAVLTIDSNELNDLLCDKHTKNNKNWKIPHAKFVHMLDEPSFNILTCLEECVEFIEKFIKNKENVLVHCLAGQSRSISIVTAYLMKNKHLNLEDALRFIQCIKTDALPNNSFLFQLKLYEIMNYKIIQTHPIYRSFVTNLQQNKLLGSSHAWSPLEYNTMNDLLGSAEQTSPIVYRCQKCRCNLMHSNDTLQIHHKDCTSLYLIDPPDWLKSEMGSNVKGKIACWRCSTKLGAYSWSGNKCSCGKWVTPAFQIHKSKVDYQTAKTLK